MNNALWYKISSDTFNYDCRLSISEAGSASVGGNSRSDKPEEKSQQFRHVF